MEAFLKLKIKNCFNLIGILACIILFSGCGQKDASAFAMEEALNYKDYVFSDIDIPYFLEEGHALGPNLTFTANYDNAFIIEKISNPYNSQDGNSEDTDIIIDADSEESTSEGEKNNYRLYRLKENMDVTILFDFEARAGYEMNRFNVNESEELFAIGQNYDVPHSASLIKYDMNGKEIAFEVIYDDIDIEGVQAEDFYVSNIISLDDKIYVSLNVGVAIYDKNCSFLSFMAIDSLDAKLKSNSFNLFRTKSGDLYDYYSFNGKTTFYKLDKISFKILNEFAIDGYIYNPYTGNGYDILYTSSDGVYAYNMGDAKSKKILDYVASSINTFDMYGMFSISENQFFGVIEDSDFNKMVRLFTKIPPDEVPDKIELTIGMVYSNYDIKRQLIKFNRASTKYKLNLIDYSTIFSSDRSEMIKQINKEISTGNMPDILVVDTTFPIEKYIKKGLLADINPLIDADPDIEREDLLENVLDAYSEDGKLYQLVPSFSIETLAIKSEFVQGKNSWTIQEAYELYKNKGLDKVFCPTLVRDSMMKSLISCTSDSYIDWDEGTCDFNSNTFMTTLLLLKQIPDDISKYNYEDSWMDGMKALKSGESLVYKLSISNYDDYLNTLDILGKDVTLIGYPSTEGQNGSVINPAISFAISADTKSSEGVWEFIKTFLSYEWQSNNEINYSLPIRKDALLNKEQLSTERHFYTAYGQTVYYDYYSMFDNDQIVPPLTKEEASRLTEFIMSVNTAFKQDTNIENILLEETQPYFLGKKPIETVCKTIQSRVRLYIGESR